MRPFALLTIAVAIVIALLLNPGVALAGTILLGMSYLVRDKKLKVTKALPNGAATTISDGIDLMNGSFGVFTAATELLLSAPALDTADLPDTQTMTYDVFHDSNSDFSTEAKLIEDLIKQTGAGGAGAAAATARLRLPTNVKRHIRVKATNSGAGDASDKSMTIELLF